MMTLPGGGICYDALRLAAPQQALQQAVSLLTSFSQCCLVEALTGKEFPIMGSTCSDPAQSSILVEPNRQQQMVAMK